MAIVGCVQYDLVHMYGHIKATRLSRSGEFGVKD